MAVVVFYEKPGCAGNARQKSLLKASGHTVIARSIFDTRWTRMQLLSFLKSLPMVAWFNPNSPRVKNGEVVPEAFDEADATTVLELFQNDPLLIRRPLLDVDGERRAGFELREIDDWIGLSAELASGGANLEACGQDRAAIHTCSGHAGAALHKPSHALES
jgi:nitrogenase-associated protein